MTVDEAKSLKNQHIITPQTWDRHTNQRMMNLHPLVVVPFALAVNDCYHAGFKVRLTDSGHFRSFDAQNRLYGCSRTEAQCLSVGIPADYAKPIEKWKTNAIGGESFHNYGLAADCCIISPDGKDADFNLNKTVVDIFKSYGFEWGGDWSAKTKDTPHFQLTFGYKIEQLFKLYNDHKIDSAGYVDLN